MNKELSKALFAGKVKIENLGRLPGRVKVECLIIIELVFIA